MKGTLKKTNNNNKNSSCKYIVSIFCLEHAVPKLFSLFLSFLIFLALRHPFLSLHPPPPGKDFITHSV